MFQTLHLIEKPSHPHHHLKVTVKCNMSICIPNQAQFLGVHVNRKSTCLSILFINPSPSKQMNWYWLDFTQLQFSLYTVHSEVSWIKSVLYLIIIHNTWHYSTVSVSLNPIKCSHSYMSKTHYLHCSQSRPYCRFTLSSHTNSSYIHVYTNQFKKQQQISYISSEKMIHKYNVYFVQCIFCKMYILYIVHVYCTIMSHINISMINCITGLKK